MSGAGLTPEKTGDFSWLLLPSCLTGSKVYEDMGLSIGLELCLSARARFKRNPAQEGCVRVRATARGWEFPWGRSCGRNAQSARQIVVEPPAGRTQNCSYRNQETMQGQDNPWTRVHFSYFPNLCHIGWNRPHTAATWGRRRSKQERKRQRHPQPFLSGRWPRDRCL